ncbi:hypothetical protein GCM10027444_39260 [Actinopolyspora lacussalsi]
MPIAAFAAALVSPFLAVAPAEESHAAGPTCTATHRAKGEDGYDARAAICWEHKNKKTFYYVRGESLNTKKRPFFVGKHIDIMIAKEDGEKWTLEGKVRDRINVTDTEGNILNAGKGGYVGWTKKIDDEDDHLSFDVLAYPEGAKIAKASSPDCVPKDGKPCGDITWKSVNIGDGQYLVGARIVTGYYIKKDTSTLCRQGLYNNWHCEGIPNGEKIEKK